MLDPKVSERFVGVSHAVGAFTLGVGNALFLVGGQQFVGQLQMHRAALLLSNSAEDQVVGKGSWDPDTAVLNGGRLFSTSMSILALESYYRFSPLMGKPPEEAEDEKDEEGAK